MKICNFLGYTIGQVKMHNSWVDSNSDIAIPYETKHDLETGKCYSDMICSTNKCNVDVIKGGSRILWVDGVGKEYLYLYEKDDNGDIYYYETNDKIITRSFELTNLSNDNIEVLVSDSSNYNLPEYYDQYKQTVFLPPGESADSSSLYCYTLNDGDSACRIKVTSTDNNWVDKYHVTGEHVVFLDNDSGVIEYDEVIDKFYKSYFQVTNTIDDANESITIMDITAKSLSSTGIGYEETTATSLSYGESTTLSCYVLPGTTTTDYECDVSVVFSNTPSITGTFIAENNYCYTPKTLTSRLTDFVTYTIDPTTSNGSGSSYCNVAVYDSYFTLENESDVDLEVTTTNLYYPLFTEKYTIKEEQEEAIIGCNDCELTMPATSAIFSTSVKFENGDNCSFIAKHGETYSVRTLYVNTNIDSHFITNGNTMVCET